MTSPLLLLSPSISRDRDSNLTPSTYEGVSVVDGQHGQAWDLGSTGTLTYKFPQLMLNRAMTLMVKVKRLPNSGNFYLGNWDEPDNQGNLSFWLQTEDGFAFLADNDYYDDWVWESVGTSDWYTLAIIVSHPSIRMLEEGQIVTPHIDTGNEHIPKPSLEFPRLFRPTTFEAYEGTIVESVLVYDRAVHPQEIRRISSMEEAWTWENTSISEPEVTPIQTTSKTRMSLIPTLWKVTRDNEFIEDISEHITSGKVSFNPDRTIKWQFDARIDEAANIKPFVDYIAPRLTIQYEDGSTETSAFGVYSTVPPKRSISNTEQFVTIDSRDLTWILSNDVFADGYTRGAGFNITNTIKTLLQGAGFNRIQIPDHPATFEKDISWGAGTSRLEVINNMLNSIGYYTLYMTKDAYLASKPYVGDRDKAASVLYSTHPPSKVQVVSSPIQHDSTPDRIANRIVVLGGMPPDSVIVGTAINNSPLSPTSTVSLGMTITKKYEGVQVADQASADLIAQRHLDTASQEYNRLTIKTFTDLSVEPYAAYRLDIRNAQGVAVAEGTWNQRGFSISFTTNDDSGVMTHELSNIDNSGTDIEGGIL